MTEREIANRWLSAFAVDVPGEFIAGHVCAEGNFLWHIFSWNQVACLKEEAAEIAFDALDYDRALVFHLGQFIRGEFRITGFAEHGKVCSDEWSKGADVYVVDPAFTWTFVHTHEHPAIGPFFCKRN